MLYIFLFFIFWIKMKNDELIKNAKLSDWLYASDGKSKGQKWVLQSLSSCHLSNAQEYFLCLFFFHWLWY